MNYFDWLELSSNTPYLLRFNFDLYSRVPQLFLSYKPPLDLQLITDKELLGFNPKEIISGLGTAITTWPSERAFLMILEIPSDIKYDLTGAPVKSLK